MDHFHQPACFFARVQDLLAAGRPFAIATVTAVHGSTPRKTGAKMLVLHDGAIEGTVGGGLFEGLVVKAAMQALTDGQPRTIEHKLDKQEGAVGGGDICGGDMAAFIEPFQPRPTLIQIGCGHVGRALLRQFAVLGFTTVAVEDHAPSLAAGVMPPVDRVITTMEPAELHDLPFGEQTYVIIATRGHERDAELATFAVTHPLAYLGVIGSRKKAAHMRAMMQQAATDPDAMTRVHSPIGLDIGSQTPEEIAVSVAAQIIALRAGKKSFSAQGPAPTCL